MTVFIWFGMLNTHEDYVELWDTFKWETFKVAKRCIGKCPRSRSGFTSVETLESIEESRAARLDGNRNQYKPLSHRTRNFLRIDKERNIRSLVEDVECHLKGNDLKPVYEALKKLSPKFSQVSTIRTSDDCLVSDAYEMGIWLVGLSTLNSCS